MRFAILNEDIENMKQYYPNIPEDKFMQYIELDPTYKKGSTLAGTYGKWILTLANKNKLDNIGHVTDVLTRFNDSRRLLINKDVMKFKSVQELEDYLNDENSYTNLSDRQKLRDVLKKVRSVDIDELAEKVFDGKDWEIWIPHTYEASCKLGRGSNWCTASTESDYYYRLYSRDGNLYIIINKHSGDKYQFHFLTESYMDMRDDEIDIHIFLAENTELFNYFRHTCRDVPVDLMRELDSLDELAKNNFEYYYETPFGYFNEFLYLTKLKYVKKIIISPNITSIPDYEFKGMEYVQEVVFHDNITEIGRGAFADCTNLRTVTLPKNLLKLDEDAFDGCVRLNELYINDKLTLIPTYAFAYTNIKSLHIPENITSIDAYAFINTDIETVTFSEGLTFIGTRAFSGCDKLQEVIIPPTVKTISERAFSRCHNLKYVYIPKSVYRVGRRCFVHSKELTIDCLPTVIPSLWNEGFYYSIPGAMEIEVNWGVPSIRGNDIKEHLNTTENASEMIIYRATGKNLNNSLLYYGGKFFSANADYVGEYGDRVTAYKVAPSAKLYKGISSISYCEENNLTEMRLEIVSVLSGGRFVTLGDAIDYYLYNGENPNIGYAITLAVARLFLQEKGYDGAEWDDEDDLTPHQYLIWNYGILTAVGEFDLLEKMLLTEGIDDVRKYYPTIEDADFDRIIRLDPTFKVNVDKVGTYGKWLLNLYKNGKLDNEGHVNDLLTRFEEVKNQLKNKDIMRYRSLEEVDAMLDNDESYKDLSAKQKSRQTKKEVRKNGVTDEEASLVYEDAKWEVWIPHTHVASCKLGHDTGWCTARTSSDYYYNHYKNKHGGEYYININKKTKKRYQFHFESHLFMDEDDHPINLEEFMDEPSNKGLSQFYLPIVNEVLEKERLNDDLDYIFTKDTMIDLYSDATDIRGDLIDDLFNDGDVLYFFLDHYAYVDIDQAKQLISEGNLQTIEKILKAEWDDEDDDFEFDIDDYDNDEIDSCIKTAYSTVEESAAADECMDDFEKSKENLISNLNRNGYDAIWMKDGGLRVITAITEEGSPYAQIMKNPNADYEEVRDAVISAIDFLEPYYGWYGDIDEDFFNEELSYRLSEIMDEYDID